MARQMKGWLCLCCGQRKPNCHRRFLAGHPADPSPDHKRVTMGPRRVAAIKTPAATTGLNRNECWAARAVMQKPVSSVMMEKLIEALA
jgi:hypothetical protein